MARSSSQREVGDDFDDAAKSALALAAVAQAASASNKSPAEAAEIAKAQANSLAKAKQHTPRPFVRPSRVEPRKIQPVELEAVKGLLRASMGAEIVEESKLTASVLLQQLANGENDALLQQLLLFEYLRPTGEPTPEGEADLAASSSNVDDFQKENMKVAYACERLKLLLNKVELAYDSVAGMLPEVPPSQAVGGSEYDYDFDDVEPAMVVPDLLPLCTSNPGDATLEFFRSCMGEEFEDSTADSQSPPDDKTETDLSTEASTLSLGGVDETAKKPDSPSKTEGAHTEKGHHSSMFSHMFSMKKPTINRKTLTSVFSKKRKGKPTTEDVDAAEENGDCQAGEYTVQIEREMLGLTVENVLERTVVRTVLPGGPAKKAGAKVGSLIVKVGNIETRNLTHFETIDELRQSQRPLQLVLRQISDDALRSAREEMGRLIRGAGFGKIFDGEPIPEPVRIEPTVVGAGGEAPVPQRPLVGGDRNIDIFSGVLRKRWLEAANLAPRNKKDEPILRAGEKLIWILSLFVIGLEREALKLQNLAKENGEGALEQGSSHHPHSYYHHSAKDYADAAKSVSKVLVDFVKKRMDPAIPSHPPEGSIAMDGMGGRGGRGNPMARGGRGRGRGRGPIPGMPDPSVAEADAINGDKLLTQIGDVLQRTRTFLADPTSAPAALFRGEVIGLLCDILDADTEMKLSEEESVSQTAGGRASPLTDLGSAGSLLKLIVLNCSIMRSPGCEEISAEEKQMDPNELKRRFGEKKEISPKDFHRLHAGNRFLAVVHRLAASRSTSARITACSLGPVLWGHLDFPHQLQVSLQGNGPFSDGDLNTSHLHCLLV
jgi:hypothetical protein